MARVRTPDKEFTAKEHKERKDKEEGIFEINLTLPVHNAFSMRSLCSFAVNSLFDVNRY